MSDYKYGVFYTTHDRMEVKGIYYLPEGEGPWPLAIISQGFRSDKFDNDTMAIIFARNNIAALIYDFCGGTCESRRDGDYLYMTPKTEVADLEAVLKQALTDERFNKVFLVGISLGGLVSSIVAAHNPETVKGLAMLYPAYVAPDDARRMFPDPEDIPNIVPIMGEFVSDKYFKDIYEMDVWEEIKDYDGPVLIVHGVEDEIVPIEYSRKAKEIFRICTLKEIPGEGHGFGEMAYRDTIVDIMRFIDLVCFLDDNPEAFMEMGRIIMSEE